MDAWLNEKLWLNQPVTPEGVEQKKQTLRALQLNSSSLRTRFERIEQRDLTNSLCQDVDCCAYLLSRYMFQHEQLETLPNIKKHFQILKHAKYFIQTGIIDSLQEVLLDLHPQLKTDRKTALMAIKHNARSAKHFPELIHDYSFIKECLKKNVVCMGFLEAYPQDKNITKKLLKARYYPRDNNIALYNPEVMRDKAFLLPILLDSNGYFLYDVLPKELQYDLELCDAVKRKHPHVRVKTSSIDTVDKFIDSMDTGEAYARETYMLLDNMRSSPFIMKDSLAIARVLQAIGERNCECYVDLMGDPQFCEHPVQAFLIECAQKHDDIQAFLETPEGQQAMRFAVSRYHDFLNFEKQILPSLGKNMSIYLQAHHLNKSLKIKEKNKHKIKI